MSGAHRACRQIAMTAFKWGNEGRPAMTQPETRKADDHMNQIDLNGQTVVVGDFPTLPSEGRLAFQLCAGDAMQVRFRKLEIKELAAADQKE